MEAVLAAFAAGPDDLTHALAGLSEPDLDLARGPAVLNMGRGIMGTAEPRDGRTERGERGWGSN